MRQGETMSTIARVALVCLVIGIMFCGLPSIARVSAASFNIGDIVEATANLNVRTGPGTGYPEITDPDYPGYAPEGTIGEVLDGPSSANGYIWWEVDFGPGLYSGWSVEDGLTKVSQPPSPPNLISPPNGDTDVPLTPTFRWGSVSNADYYGLYISEPPYGPSNLVFDSEENYGPIYGTSFTLPGGILDCGVTYYWNMRSHNSAGWGNFSNSWHFTTLSMPSIPSLYSPSNGGSTCDTTPYFDWSSVSGATSYRIQVDDSSSFSSPAINTTVSSSNYTPGSSLSPDTYYWRVQASNS